MKYIYVVLFIILVNFALVLADSEQLESEKNNLPALSRQVRCPEICRAGRRGARLARRECRRRRPLCFVQRCSVRVGRRRLRRGSICARNVLPPVGNGPFIGGTFTAVLACQVSANACATSFVIQGFGCASIRFTATRNCVFFISTTGCRGGVPRFVFANALRTLRGVPGFRSTFGRTQFSFSRFGVSTLTIVFTPAAAATLPSPGSPTPMATTPPPTLPTPSPPVSPSPLQPTTTAPPSMTTGTTGPTTSSSASPTTAPPTTSTTTTPPGTVQPITSPTTGTVPMLSPTPVTASPVPPRTSPPATVTTAAPTVTTASTASTSTTSTSTMGPTVINPSVVASPSATITTPPPTTTSAIGPTFAPSQSASPSVDGMITVMPAMT